MADYTLRIELLGNPGFDVYENLHTRMRNGGFLQTIGGVNTQGTSTTFTLPHATYYGSSDATAVQVRDWAKHATEVWGKSIVFVAVTSIWVIA